MNAKIKLPFLALGILSQCFFLCLSSPIVAELPENLASHEVIPSRGVPWPLPQFYVVHDTYLNIDPNNFGFELQSLQKCDILQLALTRYRKMIFTEGCLMDPVVRKKRYPHFRNGKQLLNLTISVSGSCEKYPYMDMDEQYRLKIDDPDLPNQAVLHSSTVWGALRGLETFSHLVYEMKPGMFVINSTSILDYPRFSFRGVLLDTSRHFVPVSVLLQNLEAMSQAKMNVFHWHIVDDQSFPYVSVKFPSMSIMGAFNPRTHIYSQKDIARVIEFARVRGIRVLAEFDSPGHTLSWGKSQAKLLTPCFDKTGPIPGQFGPIDPTRNETFTFLDSFLDEVSSVFPDDYLHLGGDEVDFKCWKSNPAISEFMQAHEFGSNYAKLEEYYMQRLLDLVKSHNKSYIVWQEVFDNGVKVKPDTVIHVWKDGYQSDLSNVTAAGYKTILSSCWYLNYINYGDNWESYYGCDPQDFNGTAAQKDLVIGGEACMWGEYVDGSNLLTRTWPRAAIVAERLWSSKSANSTSKAAPRFEELRCRMIKRGLKVEPANGPGFCECDYLS